MQNAKIRITFSEWAEKSWSPQTTIFLLKDVRNRLGRRLSGKSERLMHNHEDLGSDPSTHIKSRLSTVTVEIRLLRGRNGRVAGECRQPV